VTTASTGAFPAPPVRPGWWPVVLGVFLGYLLAALILFVLAAVAVLLGLASWNENRASDSVLQGPYVVDGVWSLVANAAVAFTIVALAAWAVSRVVADRVQEPVSLPLVAAALGLTGYAPFLALEGRFRLSGLVGLLVAAALIRWQAVGDTPAALALGDLRERLVERGVWRGLVLAGVAAWTASLAVAGAHGLTHPLTSGYAVDYAPSNYSYKRASGEEYYIFRGSPGTAARYTIEVRNAGFADLTGLEVDIPEGSGFALSGFSPVDRVLDGRDSVFLDLRLRLADCSGDRLSVLRDVRVHYRVFGRAESQLLPLTPAPAVRCS
jgi:hypothetical protein